MARPEGAGEAVSAYPDIDVTIEAQHDDEGIWHVDVYLNGKGVGGGTSPHGFLDIVSEVLYGDKNDWLNGSQGVLGDLLAERAAVRVSEEPPQ